MHNNLFAHVASSREVYQLMQDHMTRDDRIAAILGSVATFCFVFALILGSGNGWPWLVGGVAASFFWLIFFIDNSNRNSVLHMIDWIEATKRSTVN